VRLARHEAGKITLLAKIVVRALNLLIRPVGLFRELVFRIEALGMLSNFECGENARVAVPVRVAGGKGSLRIGSDVWFGWAVAPKLGRGTILLQPRSIDAKISVGAFTQLSNNVSIVAMQSVDIGEHCLIGDMTQIFDCDFHEIDPARRGAGVGPVEPVSIGKNVWIGSRVQILRGVQVGDNSVIGAGSVVTRSIPKNSVAAGVPAKVIRHL